MADVAAPATAGPAPFAPTATPTAPSTTASSVVGPSAATSPRVTTTRDVDTRAPRRPTARLATRVRSLTRAPSPSPWGIAPAPQWGMVGPQAPVVQVDPTTRKHLVWETWFVMVAFLVPVVMNAVVLFAQHVAGEDAVTRFPVIVKNGVANLVLAILVYLTVASVVPLALYLLSRTGQPPRALGLGRPSFRQDIWPGIGLAAAAFGSEIVLLIPLSPLLQSQRKFANQVSIGHVPAYYVILGLATALITAITEECLVNGYLLTRLEQLGWPRDKALLLSLSLRTSYHIYYGIGFILTIPFGYYATRSFQKHKRLNRPIAAHFIFDATLFTIAILVH